MEIRTITERDSAAVRDLFALCFNKELSQEEWTWKYMDSVWGSSATIAVEGEEIIAHYGGLKMNFSSEGRNLTAYQPCDVMTHPKYRARIFSKRGAMVRAGEDFFGTNPMDFAFGFPSERHAVLGTRQLGYTEHNFVSVLRKKVSGPVMMWSPLLKVETGWNAIDKTEIDDLWTETKGGHRLSIDKHSGYIFWRYRDNPVRRYETLVVRSRFNRTPLAFVVFSIRHNELLILDFFIGDGMNKVTLLKIIENMAFNHNIDSIILWANPEEKIFSTISRCGYRSEKGVPYIFKIMNKEITPGFLFKNYCLRQGDYDAS